MAARHIMKKGTALNDEERAALEARFAAQRHGLESLKDALRAERERAVDFVADTRSLQMVPVPDDADLPEVDEIRRVEARKPSVAIISREEKNPEWMEAVGPVALNAHAHGQLAQHIGIPKPYYSRMLEEAPELLSMNVNEWLESKGEDQKRMLRTLRLNGWGSGHVRAYVSNRYRRLDNLELLENAVLPVVDDDSVGWQVTQCGLTDLRVHIEAMVPTLSDEVRVGDTVALGVKITGSEVAAGALDLSFGLHRPCCTNLLIVSDYSHRVVHLGRQQDDFMQALMTDGTAALEDELVWRKLRDAFRAMADGDRFQEILTFCKDGVEATLEQPIAASRLLALNVGLTERETSAVQNNLITAGDPTVWGLTNALTASARTLEYERKAELERAAGKLISDKATWKSLTEAVEIDGKLVA